MKGKGHLSQWHDERGFGFITPVSGDKPVFLHIKEMANKSRRPAVGELLSYELTQDDKGRWQALNAMTIEDKQLLRQQTKQRQQKQQQYQAGRSYWVWSWCLWPVLALASWQHWLPLYTPLWYLAMSLICYIAYAKDKAAARDNSWRIAESTLQIQALLGGWPGALLAQHQLRHKSVKTEFRQLFWLMVILNIAALFALFHYRAQLPVSWY
ncbi:cold shock and DUF1294 domain-containing protein [Shewanella avicenniae]|uniref:Cold shock and DUF1294 domain-containing protein n=1 Tax=Shewanella avicenniae TaxID=2814294 RepID=A0ABX7QV71_9GAMM|nr:DUF1294 domain-containing protein [Shewanella avicenniae]QSX34551.1 cold shock and DUF1294 domain-containing protein [Shewanella avicenniae]